MAANCEYFVGGKWINESKFKELLFNGLLDQLIAQNYGKDFNIEGYNIDPNKLKVTERAELGPIKLPLIRKINKRVNFAYKEDGGWEHFNPNQVIQEANEEREKQNKKGFPIKREKIPFIITIKVGDQLQFGKLGKAVLESLEQSPLFDSMKNNLKEGQPYILVPSAYGWYPIQLWNNKIKDTQYFKNLKPTISKIYNAETAEQVEKEILEVQSLGYKINIRKTKEGLAILKKQRDEETGKDKVIESIKFSNAELESATKEQKAAHIEEIVEFLGDQIAQVDYTRINDKQGFNKTLADNEVITTNLFQENGDFFNSSSFMIMPYKPGVKAGKLILEAAARMNNVIKKTENSPKKDIDEEVDKENPTSESNKPNQDTKEDENEAFTLTAEEIATITLVKIQLDNNTTVTVKAYRAKNETVKFIDGSVRKQQKINNKWQNVEPLFSDSQRKKILSETDKKLTEKFGKPSSEVGTLSSITKEPTGKQKEFEGAVEFSKAQEAYGKSLLGETLTDEQQKLVDRVKQGEILNETDIKEIEEIVQNRLSQVKKATDSNKIIPTKNSFEFTEEEKKGLTAEDVLGLEEGLEEDTDIKDAQTIKPEEDDPYDAFTTEEGEVYEDEEGEDTDDMAPRARVTSNIDGSKWTKENGGLQKAKNYVGEKISNHLVAQEKGTGRLITFKTIEDLKEYLSDDVYEMLIEAKRQGKYLSGVFTKAALILNESALEGTEYHEAFHIVFNLALPLETRWKIINEASIKFRNELPKNATWVQIEEKLADKFMEYKLADEKVETSFGDTIDNFFKALWRSVKLFFNPKATVSIDELFENIDLGIYKNRIQFSNTDLSKIKAEDLRFKEDDIEYTINDPYIEEQALSYLRTLVFDTLRDLQRSHFRNRGYDQIIKKIGIRTLYTDLLQKVLNNYQANKKAKTKRAVLLKSLLDALTNTAPGNSINTEYVEYKTTKGGKLELTNIKKLSPIMFKLSDYLRADGLDLNLTSVEEVSRILEEDEASLAEDSENSTIEERWQRSFININPKDSLSFNLKIELSNFQKKNKNGSAKRTVFGSPETYSGQEVYNFLAMNITDSYSPDKMLEKLKAVKGEKEFVEELLSLLSTNPSLRTSLFVGLGGLTRQDFTTVYEDGGTYKVFYSNRKDLNQIIIQNILSQVLSNGNPLFKIYPKGHPLEGQSNYEDINKTTLKGLNTLVTKIREAVFTKKDGEFTKITKAINTLDDAKSIFKDLSEAFKKLNIDLTVEDFDVIWKPTRSDAKASWKNITVIVNTLTEITEKLNEGKNPFLFSTPQERLNTKEGKRFSNLKYGKTLVESLGKQIQLALNEEVVLAFRNAEGKSTYSVHLAAHINKVFAKYKDKEELQKIIELKKNDPIQRRLPFLNSLLDQMGELSSAAEQLEVIVFDALGRSGKSKKVGYMDMSDIERIEVELAHFISNGFKKNDNFGFTILPTPSDATNIPFIRMEKQSLENITNGLYEIALGEIERIIIAKSESAKFSTLSRISNHNKRAKKFVDLPFLQGKINPDTILQNPNFETIIKNEIQKYLEEDFINSQIKYYEEIGVLIPFNEGVITPQRRSKLNKYGISNKVIDESMSTDDIRSVDNINNYEDAQKLRSKYSGEVIPTRPLRFAEEIKTLLSKASISDKALSVLGINKSTNQDVKLSDYFKSWLLNTFYNNYQLGLTLAGSSAFYKNGINQQKRFKQHVSPGIFPANMSKSYEILIMEDNMVPSSQELVESIKNIIINPSNLSEAKKKELRAIWDNKVQGERGDLNNETDGATFISIDTYLDRLNSLSRLTQEHKDAAKRIKQGKDRIEDMALFPPLKPHVFTKIYTPEGFEVPLQIKNAEFILTKRFANQPALDKNNKPIIENGKVKLRYPKLAKAYEILNEGIKAEDGSVKRVDMIPFESAVKVGAIYDSVDAEGNPAFASIKQNETGDYYLTGNGNTMQLKAEDWKLQQETPPHYYDSEAEGNFGSQTRHHIIADVDPEGEYYDKNGKRVKGQNLVNEYQENIVYNIQETYSELEKIFTDEDGNINYYTLEKLIAKEVRKRNLGDSFLEAIKTLKGKPKVPYWNPNISYKIFSILHSVFKNNVTRQKIYGGQMINATSYGVSNELKIIVDPKTKGITYEALLPWDTKKYFPKDENGNVDIAFLEKNAPELLKIIGYRIPTEDKYSMFNIKIVGFTDVASGGTIILPPEVPFIAGLDFDIDKLFMIKPRFYLETVDGKKVPKYIKPLTEDSSIPEIIDHVFRSNKLFKNFVEKYYPNGFKLQGGKVKYTVEEIIELRRELLQEAKDLEKEKQDKLRKLEAAVRRAKKLKNLKLDPKLQNLGVQYAEKELQDYIEELEETDTPFDEDLLETNQDLQEIKDYLKRNFKKSKIENILELNGKEGRDNRILEIMSSILDSRRSSEAIVDVGNYEQMREIGNKIKLLRVQNQNISIEEDGKTKSLAKETTRAINDYKKTGDILTYRNRLIQLVELYEESSLDYYLPSTQHEFFKRNMTGAKLTGIFANHAASHSKAQHTNLSLNPDFPVLFNEEVFTELNQQESTKGLAKGERISKSLSSDVAAVLDNAADPVSADIGMNTFNSDVVALLQRVGVDNETIFMFLNQPIILEFTKQYFRERPSYNKVPQLAAKVINKWKRTALNKKLVTQGDLDMIGNDVTNLNLAELERGLGQDGSTNFYILQFKVLNSFLYYFNTGKELSELVQSTRVDTKPVGPDLGTTFAMINRQERMLRKPNPRIFNKREFLYENSGGNQQINKAFQKYGWLKPAALLNKIFPFLGQIDEHTGEIKYTQLGKIKNFFSNMKDEAFTMTDREARELDMHFMTYLASDFELFKRKHAEGILSNLPEEFKAFRQKYLRTNLRPLLSQLHTVNPDSSYDIQRIEFYKNGKEGKDFEYARRVWKSMLSRDLGDNFTSEEKTEIQEMAIKLVQYTYFTNGFLYGPYNFDVIIPPYFWSREFAEQPGNENLGLLDEKGNTFNDVVEMALNKVSGETGGLMSSKHLNRFILQYAQNTYVRSMIIPISNPKAQAREIFSDGKKLSDMQEGEVFVVGTNNLGFHNSGDARESYDGNREASNQTNSRGRKGRFLTYGEKGKLSQGTVGTGFSLTTTRGALVEGEFKFAGSLEETQEDYNKLKEEFIKDFNALIDTAEQNPDLTFYVAPYLFPKLKKISLNKIGSITGQKLIKDIYFDRLRKNQDFPDNLVLNKFNDPRVSKGIKIREDGTVEINKYLNKDLEIYDIFREERVENRSSKPEVDSSIETVFPTFLKVFDNASKKTVLLKKLKETKDDKVVLYKQIPKLGINQFVLEYDFNNDIEASLIKEKDPTDKEYEGYAGVDPEFHEGDLAAYDTAENFELFESQGEANKVNKGIEERIQEEFAISDDVESELEDTKIPKEMPGITGESVSWEDFKKQVHEVVNVGQLPNEDVREEIQKLTRFSKMQWEMTMPKEQERIMSILRTCFDPF